VQQPDWEVDGLERTKRLSRIGAAPWRSRHARSQRLGVRVTLLSSTMLVGNASFSLGWNPPTRNGMVKSALVAGADIH